MSETRIESDSLGEVRIPSEALYGASTQRAVENFPISGTPVPPDIIQAFAIIKLAAAKANEKLDIIPQEYAELICQAANEIIDGQHAAQFPVDIFQTGSGTSTNMNMNEVIANRCSQLAGEQIGSKKPIHPNDHVNQSQSSNDTFPTAIHIAVALAFQHQLLPELHHFHGALLEKAHAFHEVYKIGRTHLMDATPMRLGQEFSGYARQLEKAIDRIKEAMHGLYELPLGGTAVGTGINCPHGFARMATEEIVDLTKLPFREALNHFEAQSSKDDLVHAHASLHTLATALFKMANDLRLLASGPRCGLGEITLPATQPGSSIMPGKVNPVMCESLTMVCARVFGNHSTVEHCNAGGQLNLNTFMPLMAYTILESTSLLSSAMHAFREKCLQGIQANKEHCAELIERSTAMVTALAPIIGYDQASKIAKQAMQEKRTVRDICLENLNQLGISKEKLDSLLDPANA
ncbi:fumarase, class II [Rubritalea squalenifaciens DSM 18772]|uniref:Fumarate hydratase class II n=1 Tax=Rubritalea squalenifaciens DSM 18772 TaxID=1123071 RepID=A0A1M6E3G3_9BACT|nr:class II fumarate hydratase [Rubritalea squalenifaciens]SHI80042.1 fumarase, class II [Rubritalea squalenifaciens DSM 18772]